MTRHRRHLLAVRFVAAELRSRGYAIDAFARQTWKDGKRPMDLLVEGLRIAVRSASATEHAFTHPDTGRRYRYRRLNFNLHRHGEVVSGECAPDVWLLVESVRDRRPRAFVVPGSVIAAKCPKSVSLVAGSKKNRGRLAEFEDRWDLIASTIAERKAA